MAYGDGDGKTCISLSGGLDVVGHELTHGVTQFTSNLIYQDESGALNEAFSDMMGNTIEFYAAARGLDPAAVPDWLIGEDVILTPDVAPGFRNMGDPQEDLDPDHYSEFIVTTADNGGVHSNSGIPNHAYHVAVNGGKNAGCDAVGSRGHQHTADCDITVAALGVTRAAQVFYSAFTSLPEFADMCDARNATVAVAGADAPSRCGTSRLDDEHPHAERRWGGLRGGWPRKSKVHIGQAHVSRCGSTGFGHTDCHTQRVRSSSFASAWRRRSPGPPGES